MPTTKSRRAWLVWLRASLGYLTSNRDFVLLGVILFTLGNSIFAVSYLNTLESNFSRIYQDDLRGGDHLQNAQTTLLLLDSEFKDALILTGKTNLQKVKRFIDAKVKVVNTSLNRAAATLSTKAEKASLAALKNGVSDYVDRLTALFNLLESGQPVPDEQIQALNQIKVDFDQDFLRINRAKVDHARKTFSDVEFQLHFSMIVTLATLFLTVVFRFIQHLRHKEKLGE